MIIYGEFRPDNIVLGANSKVCANLAHLIANAESSHECLSARYRDQTSQHGNCCGLTSTVVTQESSNLSIVHSKVKSVHSSELLFSKSAREFLRLRITTEALSCKSTATASTSLETSTSERSPSWGWSLSPKVSDQYFLVTKNQGGLGIPNSPGNTLSISCSYQRKSQNNLKKIHQAKKA